MNRTKQVDSSQVCRKAGAWFIFVVFASSLKSAMQLVFFTESLYKDTLHTFVQLCSRILLTAQNAFPIEVNTISIPEKKI